MKRRENIQLSSWVKNQRILYRQFLRDEHTPPTPNRKSALEKLNFLDDFKGGCM